MAGFFCDSSAIVKRYVKETGSEYVEQLAETGNGNLILLARITQVEVVAAITRKARGGHTTSIDAETAIAAFEYDLLNTYYRIEITSPVLDSAMDLAKRYGLRGYDAVQLATALDANTGFQENDISGIVFVSSDDELNAAAVAEGLVIENPNHYR